MTARCAVLYFHRLFYRLCYPTLLHHSSTDHSTRDTAGGFIKSSRCARACYRQHNARFDRVAHFLLCQTRPPCLCFAARALVALHSKFEIERAADKSRVLRQSRLKGADCISSHCTTLPHFCSLSTLSLLPSRTKRVFNQVCNARITNYAAEKCL